MIQLYHSLPVPEYQDLFHTQLLLISFLILQYHAIQREYDII